MAVNDNASLILGGAQQYEQRQRQLSAQMEEVKDPQLRAAIRRMMLGEDPRRVAREVKLSQQGYMPSPATAPHVAGESPAVRAAAQATSALPPMPAGQPQVPVRPQTGVGPMPAEMVGTARTGAMQTMQQPEQSFEGVGLRGAPGQATAPQPAAGGASEQDLMAPMLRRDAELALQLGSMGIRSTPEDRMQLELLKAQLGLGKQNDAQAHQMRIKVMELDNSWKQLMARLGSAERIAGNRNASAEEIAKERAILAHYLGMVKAQVSAASAAGDPMQMPGYVPPDLKFTLDLIGGQLPGAEQRAARVLQSLETRALGPQPQTPTAPGKPKPKPKPQLPNQKPEALQSDFVRRLRGG